MSLQRCFITNGSGPQHSGSTIWLINHRGRGYHSAAAVIPRIALRQWANAGLAADDAGTCEGAWMFTTVIGVRYNSAGWTSGVARALGSWPKRGCCRPASCAWSACRRVRRCAAHRACSTGEAADSELGLALGRHRDALPEPLASQLPVLDPADVAVLGARDADELAAYGQSSLAGEVLLRPEELREEGVAAATRRAVEAVAAQRPWWPHVDLDVLATDQLAAVGYPQCRVVKVRRGLSRRVWPVGEQAAELR